MSDTTVPKSCATCPSFLTAEEAVGAFRKNIGAPMCGRYGHVLGRPGAPTKASKALQKHFAENCDSFMQPRPPFPQDRRMEVMLPDPEVLERQDSVPERERRLCNSCSACVNFIPDEAVSRELGWFAGACAAKGKLILVNKQIEEASSCSFKEYGPPRHSTSGLFLLPMYEEAFGNQDDPVRQYIKNQGIFVDPQDYPTDLEVTDEFRESGIRAWRKINDPAGSGKTVHLPIYDPQFFDDDERAKIPMTGDDEHPELYVDHFGGAYLAAVTWMELDETPALWGPAGTGKTELFRYLAWLMSMPFERVSITGQTELDDLAGKMRFSQERGTYFQYGRLPLAWAKPCVLVIDEPTVGPPDVWQFLRPLTDNSKQMVLDMNNGERIKRNDSCFLGMASNPAWDARNVGSMQIGDADASRLFHVYVDVPPPELEKEIIRKRVETDGWEIPDKQLNAIMAVAEELRGLSDEGTIPITWAVRPQLKVARALRWFDPVTAYKRGIADYLEPETQQIILDVVRAHLGNLEEE